MKALAISHTPTTQHLTVVRSLPVEGLWLLFTRGRDFVPAHHIVALQSDRNYTRIYFRDGTDYLCSRTLGKLLSQLPEASFARIHHGHAINRLYVEAIHKTYVQLTNGSEWPISRRKRL